MQTFIPDAAIRGLVVDDEPISRQMIAFALQHEMFQCDMAKDVEEASKLLRVNTYDVVVTDLCMPQRSGHDVVKELLTLQPVPMIVVHTSLTDPKVTSDLIASGVDDIVFKPVDYAAFASKMRAQVTRRRILSQDSGVPDSHVSTTNVSYRRSPIEGPSQGADLNAVLGRLGLDHRLRIDNYSIGRLIGSGGMGEVYEAEHKLLERTCAIKVIRQDVAAKQTIRDRFIREVRSVARISHKNHVNIYDFGVTGDGIMYYVMELLQGVTIGEYANGEGRTESGRTVELLAQACDGLEVAHRLGMIHRDIKPSNLMVTQSETHQECLKILDFGLVLSTNSLVDAPTVLTQVGSICGTPDFMSPEQIKSSQEIDGRADVYSLGATAYALLTGRPPFDCRSPIQIIYAHLNDEVVPPSEFNSSIPPDLDRIILKCLAKKPENRFESAQALGTAFRSFLSCSAFVNTSETSTPIACGV